MRGAVVALFVTLLLEVPFVALCYPGQRRRLAVVALVANVVTNLTMNVALPKLPGIGEHHVLVGEVLAVVVEAAAYAMAARPRDLAKAFAVSGFANALSYGAGGVLAAFMLRVAS